jgi:hypothetical protein
MPRFPHLLFAALLATPAFALDEGTYQVRTETGEGEITVSQRLLSLFVIGDNGCEAFGEGRVLRGAEGSWAAVFETGSEPCVLVGDHKGFVPVGSSCSALSARGCEFRGDLEGHVSAPVQVITALFKGRFNRMSDRDRRAVQALLKQRGLYDGVVYGAYGPGTEAAIIAQIQSMADEGQEVDGNSAFFVSGLFEDLTREGRALMAQATPATPVGSPIYDRAWSCGGYTFRFTPDSYKVINEYDGSVLKAGVLRPDIDGRIAYMGLVGYGNLTFDGVGTRNMVMHDPLNAETWDCDAR